MHLETYHITDSVDNMILMACFELRIKPCVESLIKKGKNPDNSTNEEKLKLAKELLYKTIESSGEELGSFLDEKLGDPKYNKLKDHLKIISELCNGVIKQNNEEIFHKCRKIVDKDLLSDEALEAKIGDYFKDKTHSHVSSYLTEQYPDSDHHYADQILRKRSSSNDLSITRP